MLTSSRLSEQLQGDAILIGNASLNSTPDQDNLVPNVLHDPTSTSQLAGTDTATSPTTHTEGNIAVTINGNGARIRRLAPKRRKLVFVWTIQSCLL